MWPYQTHRNLPPVPKGYPLAPFGSWFSVVVPIARTNLITNPSFETGTTSWTAIGGSIAQSSAQQYHGAYSLAITPSAATTDGARYDTVSMTASQLYAYSAKVLGVAGRQYKLCVETTGGAELAAVTFTATGRWQWVYGYWQETSSTTRRITIRKNSHASTAVFYLDGVQVEAINTGEFVSTYIDGDQLGLVPNQFPAAYVWSGTPHASQSSRSGQTRAGGMVMRLDYYGFMLLAVIGLGLITPNNVSVPYVQLDGAQYERTQKPPRQFTLAGRWDSATFPNLQRQISALGDVLDRDYIGQQQPLTLLYQGIDDCGRVFSDIGRLICSYQGGLEGTTDNLHSEQASIVMREWLPLIQGDGEIGAALSPQQNIANANYILQRSAAGAWSALGSGGVVGPVYGAVYAPDGKLYVIGGFTSMGGVANTAGVAYWDGTNWNALGTGLQAPGIGQAIAIDSAGNVYVTGSFNTAGGVANTVNIAKWNGSAWSALSTGLNAAAQALAIDPANNLYVAGAFTTAGGGAATRIAKWNGSAWSALGTGLNATGFALLYTGGTLYAGGNFTQAGGIAGTAYIAKWNGSAWSPLGAGMNNYVAGLAVTPAGAIIAVGNFTTANGVAANFIASWNGNTFSPLGSGLNDIAYVAAVAPDGSLLVGGQFTTAGGITTPDGIARWTGSAWVYADVNLPGTAIVYGLTQIANGTLIAGFSTNGTAVAATTTTVTNPGTAKTYPRITIKGPSSGTARVFQIVNTTTRRSIYLNYTIATGETARMILDPSNLSFSSDFQGNLVSTILPGSSFADFFLQKGDNVISFYAADSTVTATLTARPQYNALADLTP